MTAGRAAVGAAWLLTLVGVAVVVAVVPGAPVFTRLALTVGLAVVVSIVGQLVVGEQRGFVLRFASAAAGCFVLAGLGAIVALAVG